MYKEWYKSLLFHFNLSYQSIKMVADNVEQINNINSSQIAAHLGKANYVSEEYGDIA